MAKNRKKKDRLPSDMQKATERVLLAGVGALSVTEKKGTKLFRTLVKKGKKYDGAALEQVEQIRESVRQLSSDTEARPAVEARATGNGWYEIVVHDMAVDKVHGKDAADAAVAELEAQR